MREYFFVLLLIVCFSSVNYAEDFYYQKQGGFLRGSETTSDSSDADYSFSNEGMGKTSSVQMQQPSTPGFGYVPQEEPVNPEEYILGVGDKLILSAWGKTDFVNKVMVSAEGKLFLPKGGFINAAGRTITDVEKEVAKILSGYMFGVKFTLALEIPRNFLISVIGSIAKPGLYQAQATERASSMILKAGGLLPIASSINIVIKRKGEDILVNLEEYSQNGKLKFNPYLREGDIIFIPTKTLAVSLAGEVKRPGIYEVREGETLKDIIGRAGGVTIKASFTRPVKVVRILKETKDKKVLYYDLKKILEEEDKIELSDGDEILVNSIETIQKLVLVRGALFGGDGSLATINQDKKAIIGGAPGDEIEALYQLGEGETVLDMVQKAGGATPYADLSGTYITRATDDKDNPEIIKVDLKKIVVDKDFSVNVELKGGDILTVPSKDYMVFITGEVKSPRGIPYRSQYSFNDYLSIAAGPTVIASIWRAVLIKSDGRQIYIRDNPKIEAGDTIFVPEKYIKFWQDCLTITMSLSSLSLSLLAVFIK